SEVACVLSTLGYQPVSQFLFALLASSIPLTAICNPNPAPSLRAPHDQWFAPFFRLSGDWRYTTNQAAPQRQRKANFWPPDNWTSTLLRKWSEENAVFPPPFPLQTHSSLSEPLDSIRCFGRCFF